MKYLYPERCRRLVFAFWLAAATAFLATILIGPAHSEISRSVDVPSGAAAMGAPLDARFQYVPFGIEYYSLEDPLANAVKQNGWSQIFAKVDGRRLEFPELVAGGHFDPVTQTFKSLPDGRAIRLGFVRGGAPTRPALYAGDWFVEWEGDGEVGLTVGKPIRISERGANGYRARFSDQQDKRTRVEITRIGKGGVRNIRVYRAEDAERVKAGRIYSSRFVELVSKYDIVRTMLLSDTNGSLTLRAREIATLDDAFWGGDTQRNFGPGVRRGFPIEGEVELAIETGTELWVNAPPVLGGPMSLMNPVYTGHQDERKIARARRKEAVQAAYEEAVDAMRSSDEFDLYANRLIDALDQLGYPTDRELYLELGNEVWNFSRHFAYISHAHIGLAQGLGLGSMRAAYGYRSAQLALAFDTALKARGRNQAWTLVIGGHTAVPNRTKKALQGVEAFFQEQGIELSDDWRRRFGVTTTNYYSGGFRFSGAGKNMFDATTREAWRAEWLSLLEKDPERLADTIERWLSDGPAVHATRNWLIAKHRAHASLAEAFGARYIGNYEGGSHDILDRELKKNPKAVEFYQSFMASDRAAQVLRRVNESIAQAFPGVIISDFRRIGEKEGDHDPWIEQYYGEPTPVTLELDRQIGQ
ncbi:MAG: hypothetical protein AAFX08_00825 [Pseudomonadota bacterium]